jgi:hypothetical protein
VLMRTQTVEGLFDLRPQAEEGDNFLHLLSPAGSHAHPTLSEAVFEAVHVAHDTAIHLW